MKKFKKVSSILLIMTLCFITLALPSQAFAGEMNTINEKNTIDPQQTVYYVNDKGIIIDLPATRAVTQIIDSVYLPHQWIGYSSGTPTWTKAYQYVLTAGKTYSAAGQWTWTKYNANISLGCSISKGVDTYITVGSPTLYSKLGIFADTTVQRVKVIEGSTVTVINKVIYGNKYTDVVYQ